MSRWPYFLVGAGVSLAYLLGLYSLDNSFLEFLRTAKWNEKGDMLAGVFAPLAFFWLIVGYWMQTAELGLMRQQLEQELEAIRRVEAGQSEVLGEMTQSNELARQDRPPKLSLDFTPDETGQADYTIRISNDGANAKRVHLFVNDHFIIKYEAIVLGETTNAILIDRLNANDSIFLNYTDSRDGRNYEFHHLVARDKGGGSLILTQTSGPIAVEFSPEQAKSRRASSRASQEQKLKN